MSENKLNLTITKAHSNMWRVEMRDHHCSYACVYEPSMVMAMSYALDWFKKADEREQANKIHAKAVMEMMAIDREAGITTNMSDGLD